MEFEPGLVQGLVKRWRACGVDVEAIADEVRRGTEGGKVLNPNGCLVTACRRAAERSGNFAAPRSAGPPASYAEFRWRLIGAIMRERLSPGEVARRLQDAAARFEGQALDLAEEARYLASSESWAVVAEATLRG